MQTTLYLPVKDGSRENETEEKTKICLENVG